MKTITTTALLTMSLEPIRRAIVRFVIRCQVRAMDRQIDSLNASLRNDMKALRWLEKERALVARRLQ